MAIVTAMATSFKQELLAGGHCFNATAINATTSAASANTAITNLTSTGTLAVGMTITGTGVGANSVVSRITSATAIVSSVATTAAISGAAVTFTGDTFYIALLKATPAGTYNTASTNYTNVTGSSDEASGTGYTAAGQLLTNVTATTGSTTAFIDFSPDPSWTTATFSTSGCMIYNASNRYGGTSGTNSSGGGRCCSVHDFGGVQQVSTGTFTVLMPTPDSSNAILRIS